MSLSLFDLPGAVHPSSNTYTTGQLLCLSSRNSHAVTAALENSSRAISEFIILRAASSGLVDRVLVARNFKLAQHDLLRIGSNAISEKQTVGQYVGKFFTDAVQVGFGAPLKALE